MLLAWFVGDCSLGDLQGEPEMNCQGKLCSVVTAKAFAVILSLMPAVSFAQEADALVVDEVGNVGLGIDTPIRQLHIRGPNAVVRMDRSTNSATFMMVRTDEQGNVLKTFSVGTAAFGPNDGQFVIQDFGQEVGGASQRRMTINNEGNVIFNGTVTSSSAARYKDDIETLGGAGDSIQQLRGVRYVRKSSGREEIGLVAEEVAQVFPELVELDSQSGQVEAVNYAAMVAVLIEAYKEQEARIAELEAQMSMLGLDSQNDKASGGQGIELHSD
jgi:hypothetical protein